MTPDRATLESIWQGLGSRGRGVLKALPLVILVLLVLPFVVYAVPGLAGAEGSYVVLSGSMEPAIQPGDVVFVYSVDPAEIEPGTVITYSTAGAKIPTTHRVVETVPLDTNPVSTGFVTMGDANEDPDQAVVQPGDVLGVVPSASLPFLGETVLRLPLMGHVVLFANTGMGFAFLVGLPLALFILNEVFAMARGTRASGTDAKIADPDAEAASAEEGAGTSTQEAETPTATDDANLVTVDHADLRLSLVILGIVSVYTIWVAYTVFEPWSVSAAVAAGGTFLYLAALRYRAMRDGSPIPDEGPDPSPAPRSVTDGGQSADDETGDAQ